MNKIAAHKYKLVNEPLFKSRCKLDIRVRFAKKINSCYSHRLIMCTLRQTKSFDVILK